MSQGDTMEPEINCVICGSKPAQFQYAVYCCQKCRNFFKETMVKSVLYTCSGNHNCVIKENNEDNCLYCQFKRCLMVGMLFSEGEEVNTTTSMNVADYSPINHEGETFSTVKVGGNRNIKHIFSDDDEIVLKKAFSDLGYPNYEEQQSLALKLNKSHNSIDAWFKIYSHEESVKDVKGNTSGTVKPNKVKAHVTSTSKDKYINIRLTRNKSGCSDKMQEDLCKYFEKNNYPSCREMHRIAAETKVPYVLVLKWYTSKRNQCKKSAHIVKTKQIVKDNKETVKPKCEAPMSSTKHKHGIKGYERFDINSIRVLQRYFKKDKYPSSKTIIGIANKIDCSHQRVLRWFYKHRFLEKQKHLLNVVKTSPRKHVTVSFSKTAILPSVKKNLSVTCLKGKHVEASTPRKKLKCRYFDAESRLTLMKYFNKHTHPTSIQINTIAKEIKETPIRVHRWFNDTRRKFRAQPLQQHHDRFGKKRFSEDALAVLNKHFNTNNCPTLEESSAIAKKINETSERVRNWFCCQRWQFKIGKRLGSSAHIKNRNMNPMNKFGKRFSQDALVVLKEHFNTNKYPTSEESNAIAKKINETSERVRNWFKVRRQLFKNGKRLGISIKNRNLNLKKKPVKRFSEDSLAVLKENFNINKHPTPEESNAIAEMINETSVRVGKWFSFQRNLFNIGKTAKRLGSNIKIENPVEKEIPHINKEQREALLEFYRHNQHPTATEIQNLAQRLEIVYVLVKLWFDRENKLINSKQGSNEHKLTESEKLDVSSKAVSESVISHQPRPVKREMSRKTPSRNITPAIRKELIEYFKSNRNPTSYDIKKLADDLNVTTKAVSMWFSHAKKGHHVSECGGLNIYKVLSSSLRHRLQTMYSLGQTPSEEELESLAVEFSVSKEAILFGCNIIKNKECNKETVSDKISKPKYLSKGGNSNIATHITTSTKKSLEAFYQTNQNPTSEEINHLAKTLNVLRKPVSYWFSKRTNQVLKHSDDIKIANRYKVDLSELDWKKMNKSRIRLYRCDEIYVETLAKLKQKFAINPSPDKKETMAISSKLGITENIVFKWFNDKHASTEPNHDRWSTSKRDKQLNSFLLQTLKHSFKEVKKEMNDETVPYVLNTLSHDDLCNSYPIHQSSNQSETIHQKSDLSETKDYVHEPSSQSYSSSVGDFAEERLMFEVPSNDTYQKKCQEISTSSYQTVQVTPKCHSNETASESFIGLTAQHEKKLNEMLELNPNPSLTDIEIYARLLDISFIEIAKWYEQARKRIRKEENVTQMGSNMLPDNTLLSCMDTNNVQAFPDNSVNVFNPFTSTLSANSVEPYFNVVNQPNMLPTANAGVMPRPCGDSLSQPIMLQTSNAGVGVMPRPSVDSLSQPIVSQPIMLPNANAIRVSQTPCVDSVKQFRIIPTDNTIRFLQKPCYSSLRQPNIIQTANTIRVPLRPYDHAVRHSNMMSNANVISAHHALPNSRFAVPNLMFGTSSMRQTTLLPGTGTMLGKCLTQNSNTQ